MAKATIAVMQEAPMPPKVFTRQRTLTQISKDLLVLSRFHKYNPWLATFACVWSALLAGALKMNNEPTITSTSFIFKQTFMCFLAAFAFCGAGMVWNDWIDRDIDRNVARTKNRPLASGKITTTEALVWMMLQFFTSWYFLEITLSGKNVWETLMPVTVSTIMYPFAKLPIARKIFIYPQYILGFTLAYPAVTGWAAIYGHEQSFNEIIGHCVPIFVFVFCWTLYLNTAYSYQDVVDDSKMNINSSYVLAGRHIRILLIVLAFLVLGTIPPIISALNSRWLWLSWMGVWSATYAKQLVNFDPADPATGGTIHKSNFLLGMWTNVICAIELITRVQL